MKPIQPTPIRAYGLGPQPGTPRRLPAPGALPVATNPIDRIATESARPGTVAAPTPGAVATPARAAPAQASPLAATAAPAPAGSELTKFLGGDFRSLGLDPVKAFADGGKVRDDQPQATPAGAAAAPPPAVTPAPAAPAPAAAPPPRVAAAGLNAPPKVAATPAPTTPPPDPYSEEELNRTQANTRWILPNADVVGYGGKLNYDVGEGYTAETGRAADDPGRDYWRRRLASGMTPEEFRAYLNGTAEGDQFNLENDALDDQRFVKRLYQVMLGRDPDEAGMANLLSRLSQGWDRSKAIAYLKGSPEYQGRTAADQAKIDKLLGQGDLFKVELKNDQVEKDVTGAFKATMGRDPTEYELARYAHLMRTGKISMTPQAKTDQEWADGIFGPMLGRAADASAVAWLKSHLAGGGSLRAFIDMVKNSPEFIASGRTITQADIDRMSVATSTNGLDQMLSARKAAGYNKGGRVRAAVHGMPKMKGYAEGGEVTKPPGLSYAEYVARNPRAGQERHGEDTTPGPYAALVSEDDWNGMSVKQQWDEMRKPSDTPDHYSNSTVGALDSDGAAFQAKFGKAGWDPSASGKPDQAGKYITGYGDIREEYGDELREYGIDPSRVLKLDDGRWIMEADNVSGDWLKKRQERRSEQTKKNTIKVASMAAAMFGGAAALGGGLGGGAAAAGYGNAGMIAPGMGNAAAIDSFLINNGMSQFAGGAMTGMASGSPFAHLGTSAAPTAGASTAPGAFEPFGNGLVQSGLTTTPGTAGASTSWYQNAMNWIKANPVRAARMGLSVASLMGGGGGGGGGGQPRRRERDRTPYKPGAGSGPGGYTLGAGGVEVKPWTGYADGGRVNENFNFMDARMLPNGEVVGRNDPRFFQGVPVDERGNPIGRRAGLPPMMPRGSAPQRGGRGDAPQRGGDEDFGGFAPERGAPGGDAAPQRGGVGNAPQRGGDEGFGDITGGLRGDPTAGDAAPQRGANTGDAAPQRNGVTVDQDGNVVDPGPGAGPGAGPGGGAVDWSGYQGQGAITQSRAGGGGSSDPINELLGLGREQIDRYRRFDPLERQIIDEAGKAGSVALQNERAALAGEDVAGQFDRSRGMRRRNMARGGVNPYSAQGSAMDMEMDVSEAGAKAGAMNAARRDERDSGFGKRMAAMGLGDSALKTGLGAVSGSISAMLDGERTAASLKASQNSLSGTMASIAARSQEAAADRAQRGTEFRESSRRWDLGYDREGKWKDRDHDLRERTFGEDTRRFNVGDTWRGRIFDRGIYESDRGQDYRQWRDARGDEDRDERYEDSRENRDYNRRRQRSQDIGSGVRTGVELWNNGGRQLWNSIFTGADGGRVAARGLPPMEEEMMSMQPPAREGMQPMAPLAREGPDGARFSGAPPAREGPDAKAMGGGLEEIGAITPGSDGTAGGEVSDPNGHPNVDTVPAVLADGEMVVNAEGVEYLEKLAPGLMDKVNARGLEIRKLRAPRAAARGLPQGAQR